MCIRDRLGVWLLFVWWCTNKQSESESVAVQDNATEYVVDSGDMLDINKLIDVSSTWFLSDQEKIGLSKCVKKKN